MISTGHRARREATRTSWRKAADSNSRPESRARFDSHRYGSPPTHDPTHTSRQITCNQFPSQCFAPGIAESSTPAQSSTCGLMPCKDGGPPVRATTTPSATPKNQSVVVSFGQTTSERINARYRSNIPSLGLPNISFAGMPSSMPSATFERDPGKVEEATILTAVAPQTRKHMTHDATVLGEAQ